LRTQAVEARQPTKVAAPGGTLGFMWMMAAQSELMDRQCGVVNVQPKHAERGSGLEAAHGGRK
jgi:5-deoxy-glucuronate isomerase